MKVEPADPVMDRLDTFKWEAAKVMPEGKWKVWSGPPTERFLREVNREAAKMLGSPKGPFSLGGEAPGGIAFFGLLNRVVKFEKQFYESKKRPMDFRCNGEVNKAAFFGTRGELSGRYGKSVRVLAHSQSWHALEILCEGTDERVILYLPPEPQGFDDACKLVITFRDAYQKKMKGAKTEGPLGSFMWLRGMDDVRIPYLEISIHEDLSDRFSGKRWYGKEGDPWRISRAEQKTGFELTEKGAKIRVDAAAMVEPFGEAPTGRARPPKPRKFIYDRPFFVFLWREEAEWPYFGAWIGDTSALRGF